MGRGASSALVLVRRCVVYTSSQAGQLFQMHAAFKWALGNYVEKIATIFPNIKALCVSPFHGMTGIILQNEAICCVEVGVMRTPTCSFLLGGVMRMWPLKVGELLASMHVYGTLNYANSLVDFTQPSLSVYGILIVRTIGCILVKMFVSSNGCQVSVLHEGRSAQVGHWSISSLHDYQISFHTHYLE